MLSSLESFYGAVTAEITANTSALNKILTEGTGYDRAAELSESTDRKVEEARDLLEQMEVSVHSMGASAERQSGITRIQSYKTELERLLREYRRTQKKVSEERQRMTLLGAGDDEEEDEDEFGEIDTTAAAVNVDRNPKEQLLEDTETLDRSGRKLTRGHQLLEETRSLGASVLGDLSGQRDAIQRARNRLRDTGDDLSASSRILSSMIWRIASNKLALVAVAAVILLLIGVVIYILV